MKPRRKTARCILYRDDAFFLAVHSSFWRSKNPRWGIPGGGIEWRETPEQAARRELQEELKVEVGAMLDLGDFLYKRANHRVLAAPYPHDIHDFDDRELLDIGWFSSADIFQMETDSKLHAGYEADAIRSLQAQLAAG